MLRKFRKTKSGFTLAELLVAIVIMGILSICIYLITQAAGFTFSRGEEVISSDDVKDIVLEYVKQELRNCRQIWLVADVESNGSEQIKHGNLLFSSDRDGYLYALSGNVDGELNLQSEDGKRSFPGNAHAYFSNPADIYGDYVITISFSAIPDSTGKMQTLKVTVKVYKSQLGGEVKAEGSEIINLINMKQQNGEIVLVDQPREGLYDAYYYCFFAS